MKRLFILLVIPAFILSCNQNPRTDFVINGNAPGVYNGSRVYLKDVSNLGREVYSDTAIVMNEKFTFTGSVSEP